MRTSLRGLTETCDTLPFMLVCFLAPNLLFRRSFSYFCMRLIGHELNKQPCTEPISDKQTHLGLSRTSLIIKKNRPLLLSVLVHLFPDFPECIVTMVGVQMYSVQTSELSYAPLNPFTELVQSVLLERWIQVHPS